MSERVYRSVGLPLHCKYAGDGHLGTSDRLAMNTSAVTAVCIVQQLLGRLQVVAQW
jgi:hypothetical protein